MRCLQKHSAVYFQCQHCFDYSHGCHPSPVVIYLLYREQTETSRMAVSWFLWIMLFRIPQWFPQMHHIAWLKRRFFHFLLDGGSWRGRNFKSLLRCSKTFLTSALSSISLECCAFFQWCKFLEEIFWLYWLLKVVHFGKEVFFTHAFVHSVEMFERERITVFCVRRYYVASKPGNISTSIDHCILAI